VYRLQRKTKPISCNTIKPLQLVFSFPVVGTRYGYFVKQLTVMNGERNAANAAKVMIKEDAEADAISPLCY